MAEAKIIIKKPYDKSVRQRFDTGTDSRTKQSFRDESDINNIMDKYMKTGVMDYVKENPGQYIDLPDVMDYQNSMNLVIAAGEAFDGLPGTVRKRFENNAVQFLEFMHDPDMMEESVELGLRERVPDEPVLDPEPLEEVDPPPAE